MNKFTATFKVVRGFGRAWPSQAVDMIEISSTTKEDSITPEMIAAATHEARKKARDEMDGFSTLRRLGSSLVHIW